MGGRAGGGASGGMGIASRGGGGGLNIIDNAKQISTSDLIKMSESGGLASALATKELNSRLEVVKAGNLVFRNPDGKLVAPKGYLTKVGDAGYLGFKSGVYNLTNKGTMQTVASGGLTGFKSSEVFKPVGTISKTGVFVPNKK